MSEVIKNYCLCGQVNFTTLGPLRSIVAYHYTRCRKFTLIFFTKILGQGESLKIEEVVI